MTGFRFRSAGIRPWILPVAPTRAQCAAGTHEDPPIGQILRVDGRAASLELVVIHRNRELGTEILSRRVTVGIDERLGLLIVEIVRIDL